MLPLFRDEICALLIAIHLLFSKLQASDRLVIPLNKGFTRVDSQNMTSFTYKRRLKKILKAAVAYKY